MSLPARLDFLRHAHSASFARTALWTRSALLALFTPLARLFPVSLVTMILLSPPTTTCRAEASFWEPPRGPGGGSVTSLVEQPDGDLYVVVYGYIHRSRNRGFSWVRQEQTADRLWALSNGHLYAVAENELRRSTDDGSTWHSVTLPGSMVALERLVDGNLLAATEEGLFLSTDEAQTWNATGQPAWGGATAIGLSGSEVFAAFGGLIVSSTDNGVSWSEVSTTPFEGRVFAIREHSEDGWWVLVKGRPAIPGYPAIPGGLYRLRNQDPELVFRDELLLDFVEDSRGRLFYSQEDFLWNNEGGPGRLYHFNRSLDRWERVSRVIGARTMLLGGDGTIYVGTIFGGGRFAQEPGSGIWALRPEEDEWQPLNNGLPYAYSIEVTTAPGVVYAQSDPGIAVSRDHGLTWSFLGRFPTYACFDHRVLAAHPSGMLFAAGLGGYGGAAQVMRSADDGHSWDELQFHAWDLEVTASGAVLAFADYWSPLWRSTDLGNSWTINDNNGEYFRINDFHAGKIGRVYMTGIDGTYESLDDGVGWTLKYSFMGDRVALSPDENYLCIVGEDGIHMSHTSGDESPGWLPAIAPEESPPSVAAVDVEGTVYALQGNALWRLRSGETSWSRLDGPASLARSLVWDEAGFLYAGTAASGVARSRLPVRSDPTDVGPGHETLAAWVAGPTPFHRTTTLSFYLGRDERVSLTFYDVRGRVVDNVFDGVQLGTGLHRIRWTPQAHLSSGVYFYRFTAGRNSRFGPVTLLR